MNKTAIIGIVIVVVVLLGGLILVKSHKGNTEVTNSTAMKPTGVMMKPSEAMMKPSGTMMEGTPISMATSATLGKYLVGANKMTLYVFDKDTKDTSNCTGECATVWPPYTVSGKAMAVPAPLGTMTRPDKTTQYTWMGKPLYFYAADKQVGDTTGDGYKGVWHVAK